MTRRDPIHHDARMAAPQCDLQVQLSTTFPRSGEVFDDSHSPQLSG